MKIGIVGAGRIGGTLAKLLVDAGHEVAVSNSRGPSTLHEFVLKLGPQAHAMAVDDAASYGDIVILATPFRDPKALPSIERVAGKIVVDAMNPYGEDGEVMDLGDKTSSEITLDRLLGARLVKAFNTMYYVRLQADGRPEKPLDERSAIFVAGDDVEAKHAVMQLIEDLGFTPVDTGGLREGGKLQQPGTPIYNVELTGRDARALVDSLRGSVGA